MSPLLPKPRQSREYKQAIAIGWSTALRGELNDIWTRESLSKNSPLGLSHSHRHNSQNTTNVPLLGHSTTAIQWVRERRPRLCHPCGMIAFGNPHGWQGRSTDKATQRLGPFSRWEGCVESTGLAQWLVGFRTTELRPEAVVFVTKFYSAVTRGDDCDIFATASRYFISASVCLTAAKRLLNASTSNVFGLTKPLGMRSSGLSSAICVARVPAPEAEVLLSDCDRAASPR